jgi:large subunit ribosomal protein L23
MSIKDLFSKQNQAKQTSTKTEVAAKPKTVEKKVETPKDVSVAKKTAKLSHRILLKPLVTEKGAKQTEQNKYFFMVSPRANKIMVKQAIVETYGIWPVQVNILKVKGKKVRFGRREGLRKDWKKAIITLPQGKSIDVYKGV